MTISAAKLSPIPSSFLNEYSGRCSSEVFTRAQAWTKKAKKSNARKLFLKKGHRYRRADFKSTKLTAEAYDILLSNDITVRCLTVLASASLEMMVRNGDCSSKKTLQAVTSILLYLAQITPNIHECIIRGEDLAARILMRSAFEASDYLLAFWNDEALATEYVNAEEDFKTIWSKHLRPKEIKKLRRDALSRLFTLDPSGLQEWVDFVDCEFEIVSRAAHPSYEAGIMLLFQNFGSQDAEEDEKWSFCNEWPHMRVACALSVIPSLPATLLILNDPEGRLRRNPYAKIVPVDGSAFSIDQSALDAILHGLLFSSSLATHVFNTRTVLQA